MPEGHALIEKVMTVQEKTALILTAGSFEILIVFYALRAFDLSILQFVLPQFAVVTTIQQLFSVYLSLHAVSFSSVFETKKIKQTS